MSFDFRLVKQARWWRWRVFNKLLIRLPWSLRYSIAEWWGRIFTFLRADRAATVNAMVAVDWGRQVSRRQLAAWTANFFGARSCDTLDCEQMSDQSVDTYRPYVRLIGENVFREALSSGRGVIVVTSHFGRMPMHGPAFAMHGLEAALLTATVDDRNKSMSPLDRWFHSLSASRTQQFLKGAWLMTADNPRRILNTLQAGHAVFIVLDGLETNSKERVDAPFLGGVIKLPTGIVRLAERTNARMVFSTAAHSRNGGVVVTIQALPDSDPEIGVRHAIRLLEEKILEEPWQWWMWPYLFNFWCPATQNRT